jgi:diguanylate cyclase (GGDEF)-like protein
VACGADNAAMDIISMRRPWPAILVYAVYGFLFGLAFPLGCLLLLVTTGRVDAGQGVVAMIAQAHADQVLLYVVDTAPVFLALFAGFAGVRQDRIQRFNLDLERQVADKTRSLWQALEDARQAHETVLHMAHHDALTGLPNRSLLRQRLEQAIGRARSGGRRAALVFFDLDRFKCVNDALGHEAGDCLLREVADRLTRCVRADDTVARLGGDEFVIVLADLSHHGDAGAVMHKLLTSVAEPMPIAGGTLVVTASLGLAVYPEHGETGDALMRAADAAMYEVKTGGRNGARMSDPSSRPAEASFAVASGDDWRELSRAG